MTLSLLSHWTLHSRFQVDSALYRILSLLWSFMYLTLTVDWQSDREILFLMSTSQLLMVIIGIKENFQLSFSFTDVAKRRHAVTDRTLTSRMIHDQGSERAIPKPKARSPNWQSRPDAICNLQMTAWQDWYEKILNRGGRNTVTPDYLPQMTFSYFPYVCNGFHKAVVRKSVFGGGKPSRKAEGKRRNCVWQSLNVQVKVNVGPSSQSWQYWLCNPGCLAKYLVARSKPLPPCLHFSPSHQTNLLYASLSTSESRSLKTSNVCRKRTRLNMYSAVLLCTKHIFCWRHWGNLANWLWRLDRWSRSEMWISFCSRK